MAVKLIDGNGGSDQVTILSSNTSASSGNKPIVITVHPLTVTMPVSLQNTSITIGNTSVTVLNFPVVQTVNGSVTVGNNLSVTLLNTAITVGVNNFPVVQTVNGSVTVTSIPADSTPATQNITTLDNVSTTVTQQSGQVAVTGTPTAGSAASFSISNYNTARFETTGTWTGTIVTEVSPDGVIWTTQGAHLTGTALQVGSFTSNAIGIINVSGAANFRIRATAAMTGTATVKVTLSINPAVVYIANAIKLIDGGGGTSQATVKAASTPAAATDTAIVVDQRPGTTIVVNGSVTVGNNLSVTLLNSAITVGVNNFPVTQTINGSVTVGNNLSVTLLNSAITVGVNNFPVTQTINGSVTVGNNLSVTILNTLVDNAPFTDGSSTVLPAGYIFDEVAGTTLSENDVGAARVDVKRAQVFVLEDATVRGQRQSVNANGAAKVIFAGDSADGTSNVAGSASNVTLLSSNTARIMASFYNDSTANLYLKLGVTASTTSFTMKLTPGMLYELPLPSYTGQIDGIWDAANGAVRITEQT